MTNIIARRNRPFPSNRTFIIPGNIIRSILIINGELINAIWDDNSNSWIPES